MSTFTRRDLLRAGGVGAALSAFANASAPLRILQRCNPFTPQALTDPRLLTIFLRGGHDGVYTVVPTGDPTYTTARPTLQPPTVALPGTTFARLNANYNALSPIFSAGRAAFLHQVGNPTGARSHFVEMQIYEGGVPTAPLRDDGVIARLRANGAFAGSTGPVFGASVSQRMQQLYRGFVPQEILAHVTDLANYTLGSTPIADRQRAALASHLMQTPTGPVEPLIDAVGEYVAATESVIPAVPFAHDPINFPATDVEAIAAGLPTGGTSGVGQQFLSSCEQALALLKSATAGCQAVGVEMGAWDTHNNQAAERGPLDRYLAHGIRGLHDLAAQAGLDNLVILVMSEFGRTARENGHPSTPATNGTDHGLGGLMMAFGPRVNGGVYNCRRNTGLGAPWVALTAAPNNATPVATDFRLIYAELFTKLFGLSAGQLANVLPGYTPTPFLGCFS